MKRIGLVVLALGIATSAAHAQSWGNRSIYESGPQGTPPFAAYGFPPYSPPPSISPPPVYSPPQSVYQGFNPPPPPCVAFLGQCR